jgi:cytochrome b561
VGGEKENFCAFPMVEMIELQPATKETVAFSHTHKRVATLAAAVTYFRVATREREKSENCAQTSGGRQEQGPQATHGFLFVLLLFSSYSSSSSFLLYDYFCVSFHIIIVTTTADERATFSLLFSPPPLVRVCLVAFTSLLFGHGRASSSVLIHLSKS